MKTCAMYIQVNSRKNLMSYSDLINESMNSSDKEKPARNLKHFVKTAGFKSYQNAPSHFDSD